MVRGGGGGGSLGRGQGKKGSAKTYDAPIIDPTQPMPKSKTPLTFLLLCSHLSLNSSLATLAASN